MPKIAIELNDTYMAMSRALHLSIARTIANLVNVPSDTPVRYLGHALALPMPGSTLDDMGSTENRLPGNQRITIEIGEEYDENYALTTPVRRQDNLTVFRDDKLGVWMHPVYQRIKATMSIKLTGADYTTVSSWISAMKRRSNQNLDILVHQADYHYHIPPQFMYILFEIYRLREANVGYGEDIGKWLRDCFSPRMDIIANQAGKRNQFVIRESQTEITGYYDYDANPPKQDSENAGGAWSVGFSYMYSFDRVETMVMRYPVVVHNQMLSTQYISHAKPFEVTDVIAKAGMSMTALRQFGMRSRGSEAWSGTPGVPIPPFDDWLPAVNTRPSGMVDIFRILMQLDKHNLHGLLSLTQLGEWELPDEVLDYLRSRPLSLTERGEGLFFLSLYDGDEVMDTRKFIVSPELDIGYSDSLDERHIYRLCLRMVSDLSQLTLAAIEHLSHHPVLFNHVLSLGTPSILTAVYTANGLYNQQRLVTEYQSRGVAQTIGYQSVTNNLGVLANTTAVAGQLPTSAGYVNDSVGGNIGSPTTGPTRSGISNTQGQSIFGGQTLPAAVRLPDYAVTYPMLPVIQEDNTLLVEDMLRAIAYTTASAPSNVAVMTQNNWRLVGSVIVRAAAIGA